jgi:hypothetical protein
MPTDTPETMPTDTPLLADPEGLVNKALKQAFQDNEILARIRTYIQDPYDPDFNAVIARVSHKAAQEVLNGIRDLILRDTEFRSAIRQAIERSVDAVAKGSVIHPAKQELQKVVKDFSFWIQSSGSEYATRRLKELLATLETL